MTGKNRTLIVCRHAKADRPDGGSDFERPLAARGRKDAPVAGKWMRNNAPGVELVVCSPALRAKQTWELLGAELASAPTVRYEQDVYDATTGDLLAVVNGLPEIVRTVLLVGHNPGFEGLVSLLTRRTHEMRTAAVAVLSGPGDWSEITPGWAELVGSTVPRG
ncbi:phosphohistidine phosphatase [Saccharopolyspora erythraea NRRL 2338]|uniref:Phosphohistidine phosphatase n=2 Tax=Saccharopolyspora erythraea TaxID=1836 RepID=A4FK33_SACEN|nr:histidine phosphatase family protein [Saccharopolyspora erythraea]EQD86984.1 histidine phosphatase [Saccharopolyspora erythraea D]PFG98047.1 phosphohistidine phosphatase [Saccharopolyspora erythraea NRRL 2338]QRK88163.1 histidine phosphatase family protein [Saccharopolyspora erythraea]CAM04408.1 phosphohistidine phosphatase [Saccharopolyspora erythraea NRRL 2338]